MCNKSTLIFAVFAVTMVTIHAAAVDKQEVPERPEPPELRECEEPGENRDNCFLIDAPNAENWRIYVQEIADWEKLYPAAAQAFNAKNPTIKREEQDKLEELQIFAAYHGIYY